MRSLGEDAKATEMSMFDNVGYCPVCGQKGWHACPSLRTSKPDIAVGCAAKNDNDRLEFMLSRFYLSDNAWLGTFCLPVHQDGIRAAIDEAMAESKKSA